MLHILGPNTLLSMTTHWGSNWCQYGWLHCPLNWGNGISRMIASTTSQESPEFQSTGGRLNKKMQSYQCRDAHVKDKTVSSTVLSLTWESPYLGKTVFILRRGLGRYWSKRGSWDRERTEATSMVRSTTHEAGPHSNIKAFFPEMGFS